MKTEQHPTTRVATYARLSVNRRGDDLAIERQEADCRALIASRGWQLVGSYSDNGKSAWHEKTKRPGYEALLRAIRAGEVETVVVYETDRLARRLRTMLELFDILMEHDVVVHSVKSGIISLDSPMNIANAQMKAVFAEQYVNDARDKNIRARKQAAEHGKRHFTSRIYGWEDDGITVRESEAVVIRELVRRLIDNESGTAIASDLNQRRVPTRTGSTWTGVGVKVCAKRASNAGLRSHKEDVYEGTWEAIISRDEWERVIAVCSRPLTAYYRGTGRKHAFSGYVKCGECGRPLACAMGRSNGGEVSYRCDSRRRGVEADYVSCGKVQRNQEPVDYLIKEALIARLDGDGLAQVMAGLSNNDKDMTAVLDELRNQRQRLNELVDDYATGLLTRQQLARAKAAADAGIERLEREAVALSGGNALTRANLSQGVRHMIETADVYLLRDLAELLIKEVRIYPTKGQSLPWVVINGKRRRFNADLVELDFLV